MRIGVIIEARMSSTRLPGKVLMKVKNKTMLQLIVDRVNLIKKIDTTIVATTINKKDDEIIDWCKLKKIKFFRGSENNVLNRVYKAAKKFRLSTIILITGDCPLIDHNIISQVLNIYLNNNADYVSNSHIRTYPDGMDVQIFNYKSLSKSNILVKNKIEKEHVTLNIRRNPKIFKPIYVMAPNNLHWPELGLTLDEIGDFKLIRKIIIYFHNKKNFMFNCIDIINFIKKNRILLRYNSKVKRKGDN